MAESPEQDDELEITSGYKPPAQKSLAEIASQDAEDESLRRYKEALLGNVGELPTGQCGKKVILDKLSVVVQGRPDICLDLKGDLTKLKDEPIVMKEGAEYQLKLTFKCPGEIVPGLRFITKISKMNVKIDTLQYMVGSYGPNPANKPYHEYTGTMETAPSGMMTRGKYSAKSTFIDDDKKKHLEWQWTLEIKKHWPDEKA